MQICVSAPITIGLVPRQIGSHSLFQMIINPGHFMDVFKTPVNFMDVFKTPMKDRQQDDWQPRAYINMYSNGEITLNDEELIQQTSKKLNVEVCHVVQSIEHLRYLQASKRRREKENEEKKKKRVNMKYEDYDWIDLVVSKKK